jgi:ABC-type lipoprotein release transport system permease subunit
MARGGRLVLVGVVLGGLIAMLIAPRLQDLLFRQSSRDPLVFGTVAVTLLLVSLLATLIPAWRASRVDPNVALRAE